MKILTINMLLFILISGLSGGDFSNPEIDSFLKEAEVRKFKVDAYKKYISEAYQDDDADVLLLVLSAIDYGVIFPTITNIEEIKKIFGENNVKIINPKMYYLQLQKGKGRRSHVDAAGGFLPKESNEWFLVIRTNNDIVESLNIHFGLESALND